MQTSSSTRPRSTDPRVGQFHRFLAGWARDTLHLRRLGLDRPSARPGAADGPIFGPGRADRAGLLERPADDLSMIHWKPGTSRTAARA